MDTIWFGIKVGVGIVIGLALVRFLVRESGVSLIRDDSGKGVARSGTRA